MTSKLNSSLAGSACNTWWQCEFGTEVPIGWGPDSNFVNGHLVVRINWSKRPLVEVPYNNDLLWPHLGIPNSPLFASTSPWHLYMLVASSQHLLTQQSLKLLWKAYFHFKTDPWKSFCWQIRKKSRKIEIVPSSLLSKMDHKFKNSLWNWFLPFWKRPTSAFSVNSIIQIQKFHEIQIEWSFWMSRRSFIDHTHSHKEDFVLVSKEQLWLAFGLHEPVA